MAKSKIKQNPYVEFYLNQIEMLEEQRQYWLKHPKKFIRDFLFFMIATKNNLSIEDRLKLEKILN